MTVSVINNLATINRCEVSGDFTAYNISGAMAGLSAVDATDEEVPPKEGTYCIGWDCDVETGGYTCQVATLDWSDKQLYGWFAAIIPQQLASLNPSTGQSGIYFIVGDKNDDYGYWHVGGNDNYDGGWQCFTADMSASPDTNDGGNRPNTGSVTHVGIGVRNNAKSKATRNMYMDYIQAGNKGITVTTTNASVANWNRIAALDYDNSMGIVRKTGGAFYVQGPIRFGSTVGSHCEFEDQNQVIFFQDVSASKDQFRMTIAASSNATTTFQFGDLSGSTGISGNIVKALGSVFPVLIATNPNITEFRLYGSSFINASGFRLPDKSASREVISCQFSNCGRIEASRCKMQFNTIIAPRYVGIMVETEEMQVTDTAIINASFGLRINTATDYTLDNVTFDGCTYDVWNKSAGNASVFNTLGADAATASNPGGADTDFVSAVFLTVDVETATALAIQDARVTIESAVGTPFMNASTNNLGRAQTTYNYTGNKNVSVKVRKSSSSPKYFPVRTSGTIDDGGLSVTVVMQDDTIAE